MICDLMLGASGGYDGRAVENKGKDQDSREIEGRACLWESGSLGTARRSGESGPGIGDPVINK